MIFRKQRQGKNDTKEEEEKEGEEEEEEERNGSCFLKQKRSEE